MGSEQIFTLEPKQKALVAALVKSALQQMGEQHNLVLLTNHRLRQEVRSLLRRELPQLMVMSENEIHRGFRVEILAIVDIKEQPPATATLSAELEQGVSLFE
jgi:flagellar biosynthesis component FlhA